MDQAVFRRKFQEEVKIPRIGQSFSRSTSLRINYTLHAILFHDLAVAIGQTGAFFPVDISSLVNNYLSDRKELILQMTYVVVELCVDCKYTDCAAVCPVEAFHELPDRLYINADTCIDCDACVPECPVEAIFADTNVPEQYAHWTQINIDEAPNYPVISQKIPALHGPTCTGPEE